MASSDTGGVSPMDISGRTDTERERLIGMTKEERAWRAKYLKSLTLAPEEPVYTPEYYRARYNPIRRFYRYPMDQLENAITAKWVRAMNFEKPCTVEGRDFKVAKASKSPNGRTAGLSVRHAIAKLAIGVAACYYGWYYLKYHKYTWERQAGWQVAFSRPAVLPGDKDFPNFHKKTEGKEFYTLGFEKSPI